MISLDEVGQLEVLKRLDRLFGHLGRESLCMSLAGREQPLDELYPRGALAVRDELHTDVRPLGGSGCGTVASGGWACGCR